MEVSIPNCTGHITGLQGGKYPEDKSKKSSWMTILFNNVHQTARVLFFSAVCGGFCPFLDYQTARRQPLWCWQHFSCRKPILSIILQCTYCTLALSVTYSHASSILHNSRDNVTWSSFSVGRAMEASIPNCTVYITRLHGGNYTEDGNKNLVENRFFLIMGKNREVTTTALTAT